MEVRKEAVEVHGPIDRHHPNDADALQQADKHPKGASGSEEHRSLRCDLRRHGVVAKGEEDEYQQNAEGLGQMCFWHVSMSDKGARKIVSPLTPSHQAPNPWDNALVGVAVLMKRHQLRFSVPKVASHFARTPVGCYFALYVIRARGPSFLAQSGVVF